MLQVVLLDELLLIEVQELITELLVVQVFELGKLSNDGSTEELDSELSEDHELSNSSIFELLLFRNALTEYSS